MSVLYITGGQQRSYTQTDEWRQYGKGIIARVDPESGRGEVCAEYVSPPEVCPSGESSITFKAGTLVGNRLYVCTSTEVLIYALPQFTQVGYLSLPCFNDLHHVQPTSRGTLLIANTGLDMVVEVSAAGEPLREWHVLGQDPWARFSPDVDYRKVATTKPHEAHPNHVFQLDGQPWVTRFNQRDAICLETGDRIPIEGQRPHDGTPHNGRVYFTTIDGHIVVADARTRRTSTTIDLNTPNGPTLGWCRGLGLTGKGAAWVGFSRIRPTKFVENISWIKNGFKRRRRPTHVALYDLEQGRRVRDIELESLGLHTVFSVIAVPDADCTAPQSWS
jgi:hypothetical protein